ncbi:MAG: SdrD B-like domain-containing protein [Candidatus Aerophobetes bacterium]|nr:SdrD B-like domain-containing protein [Candidatus Aerophobetes bacterium]
MNTTPNIIGKIYGSQDNSISLRNSIVEKLKKLAIILVIGSIIVSFVASAVYAWPSSWRAYTKGGDLLWDPKDQNPSAIDLRGDSGSAAGFYYQDSNGLYFRQRVNANPSGPGIFAQYAWMVLIESDGDSTTYEWSLGVNGIGEEVELWENTVKSNSPGDLAEIQKWTGLTGTYAQIVLADSSFDSDTDYFVDWYIPYTTFTFLTGLNENSTIRFFYGTSANAQNINKDLQAGDPGTLSEGFGDAVTPSGAVPVIPDVEVVAPSGQTANPGESVIYNFTVKNTGNTLDTYELIAQSQHGLPVGSPSSITVSPNDSKTVAVSLSVPSDATAGTTDELTLTATSKTDPGVKDSDTTTTTVGVVPAVEVKAPFGQSANPGDVITYEFVVSNKGNSTDTYNLTAQSQHGWPVGSPSSITVSAGESRTVTVTVTVPSDTSDGITDDLTLTATSQTDIAISDSDITITTVTAPLMSINKTDNVSSANVGDRLVYTITYENTGSGEAIAQITDILPEGVTYDADDPATPSPDEIQGQKLIWKDSISPVAENSDSLIITIPVKVNLDLEDETTITNQAVLDYTDLNGNPLPQKTAEDETLIRAPQLTLTKEVNKLEAERGDILVYYLTIKNNGTGTAYGVNIIDTLPRGLSYLKGSSALNGTSIDDPTGRNPYIWSVPDILGNSRINLSYKVIVSPNAPHKKVQNQAELASSNAPTIKAISSLKIVKGKGPLEQKGTVRGVVFEDTNANGKQDSGEPGLTNVEIRLDGPRTVKTDNTGNYKFEEVEQGWHVVALDSRTLPEGYVLIESDSKFVDNLAPGQTKWLNFAIRSLPGKIVGVVFLDADRDGKRDPGTAGISGISIVLNDTITVDTDKNGNFVFDKLLRGEYDVRLDTKKLGKKYRLTTDEILEISLSPGETISVDFGLQPRPYLIIKVE